jgi:hypothetical protein
VGGGDRCSRQGVGPYAAEAACAIPAALAFARLAPFPKIPAAQIKSDVVSVPVIVTSIIGFPKAW